MDLEIWAPMVRNELFLAVGLASVVAILVGSAVASYGRMPPWLGAVLSFLLPVLGIAVLLIVAVTRNLGQSEMAGVRAESNAELPGPQPPGPPDKSPWTHRLRLRQGRISLVALVLGLVCIVIALFAEWVRLDLIVLPPFAMLAWGTGLDIAVAVTILGIVGAIALALRRPSIWASVIMAHLGAFWLLLGGSALIIMAPINAIVRQAMAMSYTVGDAFDAFGIDPDNAMLSLPFDLKLDILGFSEGSLDLSMFDVGAAIPAISLAAGVGLVLAMLFGGLAIAWSVSELAQAHRRGLSGHDLRR